MTTQRDSGIARAFAYEPDAVRMAMQLSNSAKILAQIPHSLPPPEAFRYNANDIMQAFRLSGPRATTSLAVGAFVRGQVVKGRWLRNAAALSPVVTATVNAGSVRQKGQHRHLSVGNHKIKTKRCTVAGCDACFVDNPRLKNHLYKEHDIVSAGVLNCHCGYATYTKQQYEIHQETHESIRKYRCMHPDCTYAAKTKRSLQLHEQIHQGLEFPCRFENCTKVLTTVNQRNAHERCHEKVRSFPCPQEGCRHVAFNECDLGWHMNVHTGNKPYHCEIGNCREKFHSTPALRLHNLRHHRTHEAQTCLLCDFRSSDPSNFSQHVGTHGPKMFVCPFAGCGARLTARSSIAGHVRAWHSDLTPMERAKENRIGSALQSANIPFEREITYRFAGQNKSARVDFRLQRPDVVLCVEIDERQHLQYGMNNEVFRMNQIYQAHIRSGDERPLAFLRFNPDAYTVDGERGSTSIDIREQRLIETIQNWTPRFSDMFEVQYLYYSVNAEGQIVDAEDPYYLAIIKDFTRPAIH